MRRNEPRTNARPRTRWLCAALLGACALVLGCTPSHGGRLMLVVTSDLPADALSAVRVEVGAEVRDLALGPLAASLPLSLVIEASPGRAAEQPVSLAVSAIGTDGTVLVTRPVTTSFLPNRTLVLTVDLARQCTTLSGCTEQLRCAPGEACSAAGCGPPQIDSGTLPDLRTPGEEIGTTASYTPPEACAALGELTCGAVLRCCPAIAGYTAEQIAELRARCLETYGTYCTSTIEPLFTDPRAGYDAVRAAAALVEGTRLAATCDLFYADWATSFERGIMSALRGTIPVGETCNLVEDADYFACHDGACLPVNPLFLECRTRACAGESCSGDFPLADYGCGDGLFCAPGAAMSSFVCARRLGVGEVCTRPTQCASQICVEDPMDPPTMRCRPRTAETVFCPRASGM